MTKSSHSSWLRRVWLSVQLLLEYAAGMLIAVALLVIFVFASRLTRWVSENTRVTVPEITWVLKIIELLILVSGASLCGLFIIRSTLEFMQALFPKTAAWVTKIWHRFFRWPLSNRKGEDR